MHLLVDFALFNHRASSVESTLINFTRLVSEHTDTRTQAVSKPALPADRRYELEKKKSLGAKVYNDGMIAGDTGVALLFDT